MFSSSWLLVLLLPLLSPGLSQQADSSARRITLTQRAEHGDARAQIDLCEDYAYGFNGAKDAHQALRWCQEAIKNGNDEARSVLGQLYFDGNGVSRDFVQAAKWLGCPQPSVNVLNACTETKQESLPPGAIRLLRQMRCDASSSYDYGSELDLTGEGSPGYVVCCHDAPHGPCGAVVIGEVDHRWVDLTAKEGLPGFEGACNGFIPLESRHNGLHDVCIPNVCSTRSTGSKCVPTIWHFMNGRYRSVAPEQPQP